MHDGAPAMFCLIARQFVVRNTTCPEKRTCGRRQILWPPRSPDLAPLDIHIGAHLKSFAYSTPTQDVELFRQRIIIDGCRTIPNNSGIFKECILQLERRLEQLIK